MANAYVYGGGNPVRTQFQQQPRAQASMLPQTIADNHSQQAMAAAQPAPMASAGTTAQSAAPDPSRFGAFGHFFQDAASRLGAAPGQSSWDPNQPFANVPDLQSGIRELLAHGGAAFGPDYLRNILRRRALLSARNQRHRGGILSQLAGLDPWQAQQAMVTGDQQASGDQANALNEADLQGAQGYQQWLQNLLSSERGGEMGTLDRQASERFQRSQRPSFLGQLGGSALGAAASYLTGGALGGVGLPTNALRQAADYTPELPAYRPPSY